MFFCLLVAEFVGPSHCSFIMDPCLNLASLIFYLNVVLVQPFNPLRRNLSMATTEANVLIITIVFREKEKDDNKNNF